MKITVNIPDDLTGLTEPFTPAEMAKLRKILNDPVYLKLDARMEQFKPAASCENAGSKTRDAFSNERANARLGEIRGWELRRAAYLLAVQPATEKRKPTQEYYQSADPSHMLEKQPE